VRWTADKLDVSSFDAGSLSASAALLMRPVCEGLAGTGSGTSGVGSLALLRMRQPVHGRPTPLAEAQIAKQAVRRVGRRRFRYESPSQAPVFKTEPPPILLVLRSP
jgi:hypothetical protein